MESVKMTKMDMLFIHSEKQPFLTDLSNQSGITSFNFGCNNVEHVALLTRQAC